ncbi:hypothetical protein GCM10009825_37110 [Arthrobacter humicola]|uniref:Uncharacterized protein n=1 Tax=Arthrobacter humicola TaxID=409291 RepID=A0ABP5LF28_9MICC
MIGIEDFAAQVKGRYRADGQHGSKDHQYYGHDPSGQPRMRSGRLGGSRPGVVPLALQPGDLRPEPQYFFLFRAAGARGLIVEGHDGLRLYSNSSRRPVVTAGHGWALVTILIVRSARWPIPTHTG